jgi:multiple antibiotic resistance protein
MSILRELTITVVPLLAIVNPVSAVPMYVAMTADYTAQHRASTLRRAIVTAFALLVVFTLIGPLILRFFGITTQAFRIAGGIIFFSIGWDMLNARRSRVKTTKEEERESSVKEDIGIVPLGIPTLAGPGAITTVIALNGQTNGDLTRQVALYCAIVIVPLICWATLTAAPLVTRRMGTTGMNVMTRLMGLLVTVVGAQFVIDGVSQVVSDISKSIH